MVDGSMVGLEGVNIISVQSVQHGGKVGNPLKWPSLLRELREVSMSDIFSGNISESF